MFSHFLYFTTRLQNTVDCIKVGVDNTNKDLSDRRTPYIIYPYNYLYFDFYSVEWNDNITKINQDYGYKYSTFNRKMSLLDNKADTFSLEVAFSFLRIMSSLIFLLLI